MSLVTSTALETSLGTARGWINDLSSLPWTRPAAFVSAPRRGRQAPQTEESPSEFAEDAAWIAEVQSGDENAARRMMERLYPTVIKSVRCHLPRRTSEEDLVQAVFFKIFRKLSQFSGRVPLEHWVSRIAVNTCLNQLKHESIRPELRMADLSDEEEAVIQHLATEDFDWSTDYTAAARELIGKLLERLRPDERLVITLVHLEERGTEEVSQITGWSVSLVKVKAFRARHKMRRLLKTTLAGEEW